LAKIEFCEKRPVFAFFIENFVQFYFSETIFFVFSRFRVAPLYISCSFIEQ